MPTRFCLLCPWDCARSVLAALAWTRTSARGPWPERPLAVGRHAAALRDGHVSQDADRLACSWRIHIVLRTPLKELNVPVTGPNPKPPTGSLSRSATATRSQSIGRHSARFERCPQLWPRDHAAIGV